ncbi:unnamed protein product [Malus baccata var. baccata]
MEFLNLKVWKCMYLGLILILGAWYSQATSRSLQDAAMYGRYEQWLARYGRVYNDVNEKETRFKIFKENVAFVESSNKDANKPYKLSVNQFADLTNEEFKASRNGFKGHEYSTKTNSFKYEKVTAGLPATRDWRKKGAVTLNCSGYKWSIKLLPSNWLIVIPAVKTYVVVLATLTVCAFEFIHQNHVTSLVTSVLDNTCNTQGPHTANITGYEDVPRSNENALLNWLSNQLVGVFIDVGGEDFMRDPCLSAIGQGISDDGQLIWHKYIAILQDAAMYGRYEQWLARYGRVYNDVNEKETRFKIFKENVALVESSNKDANKPYKLSVNQFADLTNEEFKASRNGFKGHEYSTKTNSFKYEKVTAGSCWAFSAVVATEGITQLTIDQGCWGGLIDDAFQFIQQNHGISTETNYPYIGVGGTCNTKKEASIAAKITCYEFVRANSEKALLSAVCSSTCLRCH